MSSRLRRYPKTRSSRRFCAEKFSCQGEQTEADFECEQCGSLQCKNCEAQIHKLAKYVYHDRRQVVPPPEEELCQSNCDSKNFADVRCENCDFRYCHECFERMHSTGRRRSHKKGPLKPLQVPPDTEGGQGNDDSTVALQLSEAIKDQLQPVSLTSDEDSINYVSCSPLAGDQAPVKQPAAHNRMEKSGSSVSSGGASMDSIATIGITPSDSKLKAAGTGPSLLHTETGRPQSTVNNDIDDEIYKDCKSFLLADHHENVKIQSESEFINKLGCDDDDLVKVVSIFGNTGDGKSHTLNHTFFGGKEVFKTSPTQQSCTMGVWTAFDPVHNAVIIDTEGLLGVSPNANQRTRLLLKVLAVSDVVIYRTKADRLHNDLFEFLGDASRAYMKHFTEELKAASQKTQIDQLSVLGPAVIVFHETQHTDTLNKDFTEPPENVLRRRFGEANRSIEAYSSLHYVGTRTLRPPTDFSGLLVSVKSQLRNTSVRSHRKPGVIYKALKVLNDKFSGDIEKAMNSTFPDQYFTCSARCVSCHARCTQTMNHMQEEVDHQADGKCKYQAQYDNRIYLCKVCHDNGTERVVVPKTCSSQDGSVLGLAMYAWSGYVLECPSCGVIYRSRQYWYGNQDPINTVVRTEISHVWPGRNPVLQGTHNAARRMLDGINYVSDTIASVSAKPTKVMSNWVTDQIAPPYWVPNSQITECGDCHEPFNEARSIHHCRACGKGFCEDCSTHKRPVPDRGWGEEPVRVCDNCYKGNTDQGNGPPGRSNDKDTKELYPRKVGEAISFSFGAMANLIQYPLVTPSSADPTQVQVRKYTEVVGSTLSFVKTAIDYPLDMIRDSARPAYWVPDQDITQCCVCSAEFGPRLGIHHCRACGDGVCDTCSQTRRAVPSRGWDQAVRVCDTCQQKKGPL